MHCSMKRAWTPSWDHPADQVEKIHRIVMEDRRMKVLEIAETVGISTERLHNILHEKFHMKRLCARWVPRLLTSDQRARERKFRSSVWRSLIAIRRTFCVDSWLLMKHESTTTLLSQSSGQWLVKVRRRRRRPFYRLGRWWPLFSGIPKKLSWLTTWEGELNNNRSPLWNILDLLKE